jgi:hypothetical protein
MKVAAYILLTLGGAAGWLFAYWLARRTERKPNPYDQDIDEAMR